MSFTLHKLTATRNGSTNSKNYHISGEFKDTGTNVKRLMPSFDPKNTCCTFIINETFTSDDLLTFEFDFDFSQIIQDDDALEIMLLKRTSDNSTIVSFNSFGINDLSYPPPYKGKAFSAHRSEESFISHVVSPTIFSVEKLQLIKQTGNLFLIDISLDYTATNVDFVVRDYGIETDLYNLPSLDSLILYINQIPLGNNPSRKIEFKNKQFNLSVYELHGLPILISSAPTPLTKLEWKGITQKKCLMAIAH